MKLASHNSWSYLKPRKWWMWPLRGIMQCQDVSVREQYQKYGVRCFDLRVRFDKYQPVVVYGCMEYALAPEKLSRDLDWLDSRRDVSVRVMLDIRNRCQHTTEQKGLFVDFCYDIEKYYPHIKFWNGRDLFDGKVLYKFKHFPTCEEKYADVCFPKGLDDWWPRLYAKRNNKKLLEESSTKDYLMLDFVNYGREV